MRGHLVFWASLPTIRKMSLRARSPRRRLALAVSFAAGLAVAGVSNSAEAAPSPNQQIKGKGGNFGVGASLGDPMGLSAKLFLNPNHALQFDLGWAPLHWPGPGRLGADWLWHPGTFVKSDVVDFLGYVGLGTGVAFWSNRRAYCSDYDGRYDRYRCSRGGGAAWFIRAPILGLALHWQKVPLDTVLEGSWSPYIVYWLPSQGDVSLKFRYYF